jgi:hypothetical protein
VRTLQRIQSDPDRYGHRRSDRYGNSQSDSDGDRYVDCDCDCDCHVDCDRYRYRYRYGDADVRAERVDACSPGSGRGAAIRLRAERRGPLYDLRAELVVRDNYSGKAL